MTDTRCPICNSALELREVAPCWDCGNEPEELLELANGEHDFHEYEVFGRQRIILCDFCDADFASYYASYFGGTDTGLVGHVLEQVQQVTPSSQPRYDGVCCACDRRLLFLQFRAAAIAHNSGGQP